MLLFGGITMSAPPLRPANTNVSRWKSEYNKVLARRSASKDLETKQVEGKEPTATVDNDVEIITPAEPQMLDFEESTTIMDPEEDLMDEGIIEETTKSRSACEALQEPISTDLTSKKRRRTGGK